MEPRTIETVLNHLMEGSDLIGDRVLGREILRTLLESSPPDMVRAVVPVARRLLAVPGWENWLTPDAVIDYCTPHMLAVRILEVLPRDEVDPAAEYLTAICAGLKQRHDPE